MLLFAATARNTPICPFGIELNPPGLVPIIFPWIKLFVVGGIASPSGIRPINLPSSSLIDALVPPPPSCNPTVVLPEIVFFLTRLPLALKSRIPTSLGTALFPFLSVPMRFSWTVQFDGPALTSPINIPRSRFPEMTFCAI